MSHKTGETVVIGGVNFAYYSIDDVNDYIKGNWCTSGKPNYTPDARTTSNGTKYAVLFLRDGEATFKFSLWSDSDVARLLPSLTQAVPVFIANAAILPLNRAYAGKSTVGFELKATKETLVSVVPTARRTIVDFAELAALKDGDIVSVKAAIQRIGNVITMGADQDKKICNIEMRDVKGETKKVTIWLSDALQIPDSATNELWFITDCRLTSNEAAPDPNMRRYLVSTARSAGRKITAVGMSTFTGRSCFFVVVVTNSELVPAVQEYANGGGSPPPPPYTPPLAGRGGGSGAPLCAAVAAPAVSSPRRDDGDNRTPSNGASSGSENKHDLFSGGGADDKRAKKKRG